MSSRKLLQSISTSKPPSCSSDGADIIEEKIEVEQKPEENILRVQGLTKYYGKTCALKGSTYGIRYSDCFGLVGASGAGKTTTFAIITGGTFPNSGLAILGNRPVHGNAVVGYCPQFDSLLGCLSAFQNMEIIAGLVGYRHPRRKVREILHKLGLSRHCSKCYSSLSGGQKRRISIGVAMLSISPCLILDEPTAGIDPEARHDVWKLLDEELDEGRSILLSSHSMEECEAHCSRIGVLCRGRLIAIGDSQTLKSRYANKFVLHVVLTSVKDRQHVVAAIACKFPDSTLITTRKDVLNLKWHIKKKESDRFHVLYDSVQHLASSLPIHDFCLTQASLEDVFIILNQKYDTE